ncbi:MAG TPA: DUF4838 domain-containing protein [Candidatus Paceibacterota bacterium]|nr:DUF4838 domain-containing protein [Verrucomicrobiota bacterium]HRY50546.1 DUF4838 domain-containing protein [Candidatus Paceibacterota bacterium]
MNSLRTSFRSQKTLVLTLVILALAVRLGTAAGPALSLVRDGKPTASIVVARSAGHTPWFAAGELQYHVRKITGATLPIVTDDLDVKSTRILVGSSRQTEALGLRNAAFKAQEYLIGFRPDTLVLMGRDREDDAFPVRVTGRFQRVEGRFGQALEFTGAQAVSVSSHGFSDEAGTLEAWVYLGDERPDAGTIFRLDGDPWTYHIVDLQGVAVRYLVYDGKSGRSVTSSELANGWHHICATHDARAGRIELFVDGASCGTAAYTRTSCSNAPALCIGAFLADGKPGNAFRGRVDEARVSRAVRPPAADWASRLGATDTETLVRLSFDEASGPPRELSGRPRATAPPSLDDNMTPQGTCYAVYDFLERFCGVRWYAPTELGMVFPRRVTLEVSGEDIRRAPAFEFRHHAPSGVAKAYVGLSEKPTDEEQRLFVTRRRLGGRNFMTNHSFYDFYDRFWERNPKHPEAFEGRREEFWAKGYQNRPPQLCYTSPQLIAQVVKDARGKLDAGADYVPLVPMDNDQQCKCADCQALLDKENKSRQFSTGKASGLFWSFADAVARDVRQSHPDKFVGTIAYFDYAFPPRFEVQSNILVGPCLHTRNWWSPSMERNDMAFYQGWVRQAPGRLHCVWLYQCFPDEIAENNQFKPFPGFHAHTLSRQFQIFGRDKVRGVFLCGVASYIDGHLTFRCLDDPFFDVDRALDEFFTRYYGPAAAPMKQLYLGIEQTYMTPANYPETVQRDDIHFHQTEEMAWKYLGTTERMAAWARLVQQAQAAAASTPEHAQRVAIFVKSIWNDMLAGRRKWEARQNR